MRLEVLLVLLVFLIVASNGADDEDEGLVRISSEVELITYDLSDECTDISSAIRSYLNGDEANGYRDKVNVEQDHGRLLRVQAQKLSGYEADAVPYELQRNWTRLTRCGDFLLDEEEYNKLITFANGHLERSRTAKISCNNGHDDCRRSRPEVLKLLASSRNETDARDVWSEWRNSVDEDPSGYGASLGLVTKAATLNGQYDAKSYWEMMVDVTDGYSKAESLWEEIGPLYGKLHDFVRNRMEKYYNTSFVHIPVYLLGSKFGEDWSNVADIVLPHPQLYHQVKVELNALEVRRFYKYAENFTRNTGLGGLGKHFWKSSSFTNANCGPTLLNYCNEQHSEVVTCSDSSIDNYLKAHKAATDLVVDQRDYTGLPQRDLRQSPVLDAVRDLSELLALNALPYNGLLPTDFFTKEVGGTENRMTALMLLALRILPRLAYHRAVDVWRLQELEEPSEDPAKTWWEIRKKFQLVEGVTNSEPDFLEDEVILYNKPYLSKFLGAILQFQFLNYHQINLFYEPSNTPNVFKEDANFREMLDNVRDRDPLDLVGHYYSFDDVSAYPLKDFFYPLLEYMETAPEKQAPYTVETPKAKSTEAPPQRVKTKAKKARVPTTPSTSSPPTVQSTAVAASTTETVRGGPDKGAVEVPRSAGGYVGIAIVVGTLGAVIAVCVWRRMKSKPKTNNRRRDEDV